MFLIYFGSGEKNSLILVTLKTTIIYNTT